MDHGRTTTRTAGQRPGPQTSTDIPQMTSKFVEILHHCPPDEQHSLRSHPMA